MVKSIQIERLRGIREGRLDDLTPLVILVGPNGCGKSTVLDAFLIGCHPVPAEGLSIAAGRHSGTYQPGHWLLWREGSELPVTVCVVTDEGGRTLRIDQVEAHGRTEQLSGLVEQVGSGSGRITATFDGPNRTGFHGWSPPGVNGRKMHLVDAGRPDRPDPAQLWSTMIKRGRRDEALLALRTLLPDAKNAETLVESGKSVLYVDFGTHAVPAAVTGDGVYGLLSMSLEIADVPDGLVLLEEPELHLHPAAIWQAAKVIWAAVRRGVQVVLSTHSLELIDALLGEAAEDELDLASVYSLVLRDGVLEYARRTGEEARFSRFQIEQDLR